jgi:hypothetical protein
VYTRFLGIIPESRVATWIIVLAIICGILLFFLIAMALYKVKPPTCLALYSELYATTKTGLKANLIRTYFYRLGDNVVVPRHADKWGRGGIAPQFWTSTLYSDEWLPSRPGRFISRERALNTHWTRRLDEPRVDQNAVE